MAHTECNPVTLASNICKAEAVSEICTRPYSLSCLTFVHQRIDTYICTWWRKERKRNIQSDENA